TATLAGAAAPATTAGKQDAVPDRVLPSALGLRPPASPAPDVAPRAALPGAVRRGTGAPHRRAAARRARGCARRASAPTLHAGARSRVPRRPAAGPEVADGRLPGRERHRRLPRLVLHADGAAAARFDAPARA